MHNSLDTSRHASFRRLDICSGCKPSYFRDFCRLYEGKGTRLLEVLCRLSVYEISWWAAVAADIAHIAVEPWKLLILTDTSWECGEGKCEAQVEIEMALQTSERTEALLKEQPELNREAREVNRKRG